MSPTTTSWQEEKSVFTTEILLHFNKTAQPNSKPTDLPFQHTGKIRNCAKISAVSDSEYGKLAGP